MDFSACVGARECVYVFYMHVFAGEFLNEGESACLCEWVGLFSCVCVNACVSVGVRGCGCGCA